MDSNSGKFIPPDAGIDKISEQVTKGDGGEAAKVFAKLQETMKRDCGPGNKAVIPTLKEGEIHEIKGVKFRIKRIKPYSGYVSMEMIPRG